jgi:hypothetical protein
MRRLSPPAFVAIAVSGALLAMTLGAQMILMSKDAPVELGRFGAPGPTVPARTARPHPTVAPASSAHAGRSAVSLSAPARAVPTEEPSKYPIPPAELVCGPPFGVILAGETRTLDCTFHPNGFRGTFEPSCLGPPSLAPCTVSPKRTAIRDDADVPVHASWTVDPASTLRGAYRLGIGPYAEMFTTDWRATFNPEPVGGVDVTCPAAVTLPSTGIATFDCVLDPDPGFYGTIEGYGRHPLSRIDWFMEIHEFVLEAFRLDDGPRTVTVVLETEHVPNGTYVFPFSTGLPPAPKRTALVTVTVVDAPPTAEPTP